MAVVVELPKLARFDGGIETRIAAVDLSNYQYCAVSETAATASGKATVGLPTGNGVRILGILLNAPTAGQLANIAVAPNLAPWVAGTTFNAAIELMTDTNGRAIAATGTVYVAGVSEEASQAVAHVVRVKLQNYQI
jgi:hypothetical protein